MSPRPAGKPDPAFLVEGLSKSFANTLALADVDLTIDRGEIRGLAGPNGSGKSTLVKIMSGYHHADRVRRLSIGGRDLADGFRPSDIQAAGVGFVHQDLALVDQSSIEDNLAFGPRGFARSFAGRIDWKAHRRRVGEALERVNLHVDPQLPVAALAPAEKTLVAIARALSQFDHAHLLVLDEPTARLPHADVDLLLGRLKQIAEAGTAILYITHRMNELFALSDRITVFKDGRNVATLPASETSVEELTRMMTGEPQTSRQPSEERRHAGDTVVSLRGLSTDRLHDVSLTVAGGEILALTGVIGSGAEDCGDVIYGLKTPLGGEIVLDGRAHSAMTIPSARAAGVAYLPPERTRAGFADSTVAENVVIADFAPVTRGLAVDARAVLRDAWSVVRGMGVVPADPTRNLRALSGGNQQKVLFGKWLRVSPRLMILNEPTYGVDVVSRRELFAGIQRARDSGMAVLWVTTDLEEAVAIADRIGVFFRGRLKTIRPASEVTASDLNRAATGL
ncbi:MAG: sugar ABC transporter ATP-binding protein [Rhizobiaceae bacterium]|nr:sugar ABC transporter ATP-binding protein [Rhizobiaceae bacterium]